jgi:hypothetical protein
MTTFTPGLDGSKYRLRGYPDSQVRIYATDGGGAYPIHAAYKLTSGSEWDSDVWTVNGAHSTHRESFLDIIDREPEVVRVVVDEPASRDMHERAASRRAERLEVASRVLATLRGNEQERAVTDRERMDTALSALADADTLIAAVDAKP